MSTSSADPAALERYVTRAVDADGPVAAELGALAAALDAFRNSGSVGVPVVHAWDSTVRHLLADSRELAEDVAAIAGAFREADSGASGGASGIARVPDAELERSLRLIRIRQQADAMASLDEPFDLLANMVAMPQDEWFSSLHGATCGPIGADAHYGGGGAVVGPDGRSYPLVVPSLRIGDQTFTGDANARPGDRTVGTLGGVDPGWVLVGARSGVDRLQATPGRFERFAVGLAGTNPNLAPRARALEGDEYRHLLIDGYGRPRIELEPRAVGSGPPSSPPSLSDVRSPAFVMIDGKMVEFDRMAAGEESRGIRRAGVVAANVRAQRAAATMSSVEIATSVLAGASLANTFDDFDWFAYQIVFEENIDGRLRAQARSYQMAVDERGEVVIHPDLMFLDGDHLERDRLRSRVWNPEIIKAHSGYRVAQ